MKKVEKVSIAEISFTLDSDAYVALKQYLDSLQDYYEKDPDGREIIADIEARIAELILNEQIYTKVVSRQLVDTIIAQLGTPEEIGDEVGEGDGVPKGGYPGFSGTAATPAEASIPRRLHRDAEGKIFGGVCSGLAKFMDTSVAWVRLAFLFPFALAVIATPVHWHWLKEFGEGWFWVFVVTYIVLWIALPMARTPRQKLEARGEKITPASIRQTMQGSVHTPAGRKAASVAAELVNVMGRMVLFFVKFVMAVIGFSLLFAAIGVFMGMIVVLFEPHTFMFNSHSGVDILSTLAGMSILSPLMFVELVLVCVLLPLFVIGMALLSFTFSWRLGRVFYGVTLGAWAVAIIFLGVVSASNVRFFRDEVHYRVERWGGSGHTDGEWRSRSGRVKVQTGDGRDSLGNAGVSVDGSRDSLVIVVKRDGTPNDTLEVSPNEATNEVGDRRRVEIKMQMEE